MNYLAVLATIVLIPQAHAAFSDVSTSHPHYSAVVWAYQEGIVQGYPDGTFRPDNTINRAEFLKIVVEASDLDNQFEGCEVSMPSDVNWRDWFAAYIFRAFCIGMVSGYPDGTFRPADPINFVEAAKIVVNAATWGCSIDECLHAQQPGEQWYERFVRYLSDHQAIPSSIENLDQLITRGEMLSVMYRLSGFKKPVWKTFVDAEKGFALEYPADALVWGGHGKNQVIFEGQDYFVIINFRDHWQHAFEDYMYMMNFNPVSTTQLDDKQALVFTGDVGYCDGGSCGGPFTAFAVQNKDGRIIELVFSRKQPLSEIEEHMRDSFMVLD